MNYGVIRAGLEALYFSGAHLLMSPFTSGVGTILTLHHVRPLRRNDRFQPNRILEVTPDFLDRVLRFLRRSHVDVISLDEMHRRLVERDFRRHFVCITLDDGYRDNLEHAYPLFKQYATPFAIYLPTSFPDRLGELWWLVLEAVVARNVRIGLVIDGVERHFECRSNAEKWHLFNQLYWWLRSLPTEQDIRAAVHDLASRYNVSIREFCDDLCMNWSELAQLAEDPLVTIGAHTVNHVILTKVTEKTARAEMQQSQAVIEAALGKKPTHFSYPFGDPGSAGPREFAIAAELGFKTAVTTRPGVLFREHREHLFALPRISLNGKFQSRRHVRVLLSGAATALQNGFRRVDAA